MKMCNRGVITYGHGHKLYTTNYCFVWTFRYCIQFSLSFQMTYCCTNKIAAINKIKSKIKIPTWQKLQFFPSILWESVDKSQNIQWFLFYFLFRTLVPQPFNYTLIARKGVPWEKWRYIITSFKKNLKTVSFLSLITIHTPLYFHFCFVGFSNSRLSLLF